MVRTDCRSSVPPHIQPPIAQVPRPTRDTVISVFVIFANSMLISFPCISVSSDFFHPALFRRLGLYRLNRLSVVRRLSNIHCEQVALVDRPLDLNKAAVVKTQSHL